MASKPQGTSCLHFPYAEITEESLGFYSSPASALQPEKSLQLPASFPFNKKQSWSTEKG